MTVSVCGSVYVCVTPVKNFFFAAQVKKERGRKKSAHTTFFPFQSFFDFGQWLKKHYKSITVEQAAWQKKESETSNKKERSCTRAKKDKKVSFLYTYVDIKSIFYFSWHYSASPLLLQYFSLHILFALLIAHDKSHCGGTSSVAHT